MCFDLCHSGSSNGGKKYPLGHFQKGAQYLMLKFTLLARGESGKIAIEVWDGLSFLLGSIRVSPDNFLTGTVSWY